MIARALLAALLLAPLPAGAAEHAVGLSSFDRLRVDAPVEVRVIPGTSPAARITGDAGAIAGVDLRQNGTTVTIARRTGGGEQGTRVSGAAAIVTLVAPALSAVMVNAGAQVAVARAKGARVDLSVAGAGTLAVASVEAEQAALTLIGTGALSVAGGRAATMRVLNNGSGTIDAAGMEAASLMVRAEGVGETRARARYTATVANAGSGRVVVLGQPRCTVRAAGGGPVACGAGEAR